MSSSDPSSFPTGIISEQVSLEYRTIETSAGRFKHAESRAELYDEASNLSVLSSRTKLSSEKSQRFVIDKDGSRTEGKWYSEIDQRFALSPRGDFAYLAKDEQEQWFVVLNGREGRRHEYIDRVIYIDTSIEDFNIDDDVMFHTLFREGGDPFDGAPLKFLGDKLVYISKEGHKSRLEIFDGSVGPEFDTIWDVCLIGGKIAYTGSNYREGCNNNRQEFVVWGNRYEAPFVEPHQISRPIEVGERPFYFATNEGGSKAVWGTSVADFYCKPFEPHEDQNIILSGIPLLIESDPNSDRNRVVDFHGDQKTQWYDSIHNVTVLEDKPFIEVTHDGQNFAIFDGKRGPNYNVRTESAPQIRNGEIIYEVRIQPGFEFGNSLRRLTRRELVTDHWQKVVVGDQVTEYRTIGDYLQSQKA